MTAPETAQAAARAALARLAETTAAQIIALQAQLAAVQALQAAELDARPADTVLGLYVAVNGAPPAVKVLDAMGWRLPGVKGPRRWQRDDVYALIEGDETPACPVLRAMARAGLKSREFGRKQGIWSYG